MNSSSNTDPRDAKIEHLYSGPGRFDTQLFDIATALHRAGANVVFDVRNHENASEIGGLTKGLQPDAPFASVLVLLAARANGNFDSFIMSILKHMEGREHGSIYLNILQNITSN